MENKTENIESDIDAMLHAGRVSASLRLLKQWRSMLANKDDDLCPGESLVWLALEAPQEERELDAVLSHVWRDRRMRARFIARYGLTVLGLLRGARWASHD